MVESDKTKQLLEEIFRGVGHLPELPITLIETIRLLDCPQASARDLARVIQADPALTFKVLHLVNSAEYGLTRHIGSMDEAVSVLGHDELRRMIYGLVSHSLLARPLQGYGLERGELWENAVGCAFYARHIAEKVGFKDTALAFTSGLLRDLGKIILESHVRGNWKALESLARSQHISFAEAEEQLLGIGHTLVGFQLASRWNLSPALECVMGYHHKPSAMAEDSPLAMKQLVSIVHLADTFIMRAGFGLGVDGLMYPLDMAVFENLKLSSDNDVLESLYAELLSLQDSILKMSFNFDAQGSH